MARPDVNPRSGGWFRLAMGCALDRYMLAKGIDDIRLMRSA